MGCVINGVGRRRKNTVVCTVDSSCRDQEMAAVKREINIAPICEEFLHRSTHAGALV